MEFLKNKGFIIGKKDLDEADVIITVLSEDFGKISFLVKGIRKSKRRDKTAIDPVSLTEFTFYKKHDSYIISNFQSVNNYWNLKSTIENLSIALYMSNVVNKCTEYGYRTYSTFKILKNSLNYLDKNFSIRANLVLTAFFLKNIINFEGINFNISNLNDLKITIPNQNVQKILQLLLENNVKEIISTDFLDLSDIKNTVLLLEKYINYNFDINIDIKKYLMGELK